jgi:hypothetical protein
LIATRIADDSSTDGKTASKSGSGAEGCAFAPAPSTSREAFNFDNVLSPFTRVPDRYTFRRPAQEFSAYGSFFIKGETNVVAGF